MSETRPLLSIVCPAFEEESALPLFHRELMIVADRLAIDYAVEVIYVDDGSRDRTLDVLAGMAAADSRVGYLSLSRNFGHQAALTAGLEHARGDVVISMDSDLQHPPEIIPLLLEQWKKGADIVITIRADDPSLKWSKRFSSRLFYKVLAWMSETEVRPSASDFRLMSRPAVLALLRMKETHRFVRGMVQWLGFHCEEVQFEPRQRVAGRSKYTFRKQLNLGLNGMLAFSKLPLRLVLAAGIGLLGVGTLCSIWLIASLFLESIGNPVFWTLLAAINLIGGTTLIGLGIVGEYVGRIYEQVKDRPIYFLKQAGNVATQVVLSKPGPTGQRRAA